MEEQGATLEGASGACPSQAPRQRLRGQGKQRKHSRLPARHTYSPWCRKGWAGLRVSSLRHQLAVEIMLPEGFIIIE